MSECVSKMDIMFKILRNFDKEVVIDSPYTPYMEIPYTH